MATLKQWQVKYQDTISCKLTLGHRPTDQEANKLAKKTVGDKATILEIKVRSSGITVFYSAQAKAEQIADATA